MSHVRLRRRTLPSDRRQRDVWLDQISRGDSPLYNIGGYMDVDGPLDATTLQRALDLLVATHESLRTVLLPGAGADGLPLQTYATNLSIPLTVHDFSAHPQPVQAAQASGYRRSAARMRSMAVRCSASASFVWLRISTGWPVRLIT